MIIFRVILSLLVIFGVLACSTVFTESYAPRASKYVQEAATTGLVLSAVALLLASIWLLPL